MCSAYTAYGGEESAYRVLVRKPEGRGPFGRPWSRWEDNFKMNLQEVGYGVCTE